MTRRVHTGSAPHTGAEVKEQAEGKSAKNRMHVDVRVAGPGPCDMAERARLIRQKVPELVDAGATVVREEWYGDALGHVVMQDPEGNEFCVA
ncbi:VOC family protein [Micromonospora sp. WMMC415]|uniref:VOC family protein n=1 Tax=Micromonospora sp. WMMC415 TaxID=2675222 RepID=UPI0018AFF244|nr:VOC family protein [Micromonospora sp. WMMC415]